MHFTLHDFIHLFAVIAVSALLFGVKENFVDSLKNARIFKNPVKRLYRSIRSSKQVEEYLKTRSSEEADTQEVLVGVTGIKVSDYYLDGSQTLEALYSDQLQDGSKLHRRLKKLDRLCKYHVDSDKRIDDNFKGFCLFAGLITFCFLIIASFCSGHVSHEECPMCHHVFGGNDSSYAPIFAGIFVLDVFLALAILIFSISAFIPKFEITTRQSLIAFIVGLLLAVFAYFQWKSLLGDEDTIILSVSLILIPWVLLVILVTLNGLLFWVITETIKNRFINGLESFNDGRKSKGDKEK